MSRFSEKKESWASLNSRIVTYSARRVDDTILFLKIEDTRLRWSLAGILVARHRYSLSFWDLGAGSGRLWLWCWIFLLLEDFHTSFVHRGIFQCLS